MRIITGTGVGDGVGDGVGTGVGAGDGGAVVVGYIIFKKKNKKNLLLFNKIKV